MTSQSSILTICTQTLFREALLNVEDLKRVNQDVTAGTSTAKAAEAASVAALAALSRVSGFYLELIYNELVAAVNNNFKDELKNVTVGISDDPFWSFLNAIGESKAYPHLVAGSVARQTRKDILVALFRT